MTTPVPTAVTSPSEAPTTDRLWMTVEQASARWKCSPRTVERTLRRLGIAPLRLGRAVRVDVLAVERLIEGTP